MKLEISDKLWEVASQIIPQPIFKGRGSAGGRPNKNLRVVLTGIIYWMKTGCQVELVPDEYGSTSTLKRYFYLWVRSGAFDTLYHQALAIYDEEIGIDWKWQSIDGSHKKSPYCKEQSGPNPTDRAKPGTKLSVMTDGNGIPISIVVNPANQHDSKSIEENFCAIMAERPDPKKVRQHLCGDKAFDSEEINSVAKEWGFIPHIKSRGKEITLKKRGKFKPRRWVVERTHAWLNGSRGIFTRWLRSAECFAAFVALSCSILIVNKLAR